MVTSLKEQPLKRQPVYRNIHVTDLTTYRLPPAGWVSILHRISGAAMFLLLPFTIWLFDASLTSEVSYEEFASVFSFGAAGLPAKNSNGIRRAGESLSAMRPSKATTLVDAS